MRYSLLGRTGVKVSRLALGTMTFGSETDETASAEIVTRARDAGINFIDTADVYSEGRAEEIVGRLIGRCRDEVVLATKAYYPTGRGPNSGGSSRYHLVRAVEASLRRLATDHIDIYYLHHFDDHTDVSESLRALDDLIRQGKILYPSCSNFAAWQVAHALGLAAEHGFAPLCAVQPMYNLLKRQAEVEILPMAEALGIAVVPYSPTAGGLLTGKYAGNARPGGTRFGTDAMYRARYEDAANWATADAFRGLASELGHSPATLAIAWVASHPTVTSVLLGARTVAQVEEDLAAADVELDDEIRSRISGLTPAPAIATDRSEERASPAVAQRSRAAR
jgi:aryl-alcohol dehydrogenase-like predicted oxidoreductase